MALEQINNGDSGAIAAAKIFNNDKKAAALTWSTSDAGAVYPTVRVEAGVLYQVIDGQTATTAAPSLSPDVWRTLGAKALDVFDRNDTNNAATMNATAKYITERIGIIDDSPGSTETFTNGDGQTLVELRPDNTVVASPTSTNVGVFHNMLTNGATKITLTGYLFKETSAARAGVLGILANGTIVNLTASFTDYQLLDNTDIDVSAYDKISVAMTGAFTMVVTRYSGNFYPNVVDYFIQNKDLIAIKERIRARYISTYKGTTALAPDNGDWEVTPFLKTKAGDRFTGNSIGRLDAYSYAIYDANKKFIKGVTLATSNGQKVDIDIIIADDGYICFGNFSRIAPMTIYLNRSNSFDGLIVETLNKIEPKKINKLSAATPTNLKDAKFYEPYIDTGVMKVKTPSNLVEKLVLNDDPHIVENRFIGEHSFVYFKGRILVYHSEAKQKANESYIGFLSVGEIGEESEKYTYLQKIIGEGDLGVPAGYSVHRSCAFVNNNQVYITATVENGTVSEIWMFKSADGFNFTKVKTMSNSGFGFANFGNLWLISEQQIDGYYYFFFEGNTGSGATWSMKIARATSIEGDYTYYQDVTGLGTGGGMVGGVYVRFYNNKFRIFYHYGVSGNLPTYLGYGESDRATPGTATVVAQPVLALANSPIGTGTDQNGDQALLEINGSIWWGYQYAINSPILNGVFCYKKLNGLTYAKLFA